MSAAGRLARAFLERHPRRAAERLGTAPAEEVAQLLHDCDDTVAAEALQHVDPVHAGRVLEALAPSRRAALLAALPSRRAALVVQDADSGTADAWLSELPEELSRGLRAALAYPDDSAARLMDPAVLAAPVEMNAAQARRLVARHAARALYYLYVIDAERRPVGVLNLRELMGASPKTPLAGLMHAPVVTVPAHAAAAVVATHPGWSTLHALPVVDEQGLLIGVLRYETAERIRRPDAASGAPGVGVGVALTEALWAVTAHVVDQVATAARPAAGDRAATDEDTADGERSSVDERRDAGGTVVSGALALERTLARALGKEFGDDAAAELELLPPVEVAGWLAELDPAEAAELLARLAPVTAERALDALVSRSEDAAAAAIAALDASPAALLLSRMPLPAQESLLRRMPSPAARELRQLSAHPPGTAGSLMDPQVLALRPDASAAEALDRLRERREKRISRVYLVGRDHKLLGSVRVRDLAVAEPQTPLKEMMLAGPPGVPVTADREQVSEVLAKERATSLPVVDFEGHLVGVLRYDTLMDAARDEATADIQSMVGAGKEERALSPVRFAVRKRLPWLQINLLTAFLAASVVGLFESTIARYTALAVLLPVVAGQSGNTGAQALAVTMRGLALREIRVRQWLRICLKEANVGLLNGVAVALTTSVAVLFWSSSVGLALVIGSSMIISMVAAGLAGAATPMVLTALGQDPAQSSSIILTTVTDVVGFFSFLGIATVLSSML